MEIFTKIIRYFLVVLLIFGLYGRVSAEQQRNTGSNESIYDSSEYSEDITPPRGDHSPCPKKKDNTVNTTMNTGVYSWYCKHMNNHERPPLPAEMSFISDYDGYYLGADEKKIYLTFDAGYENGNIARILDVLKKENVPAAFFILENLVTRNNDLVLRMANEGHTVCNHTASHKDMTKLSSKDEFAAELEKMASLYSERIGGELSMFYRPPEGKFNEENLNWAKSLGYKTIFWSFAYADWDNNKQMDPERAKEKILAGTHNGEVILLHPTSKTNADILSDLIKSWKEMGYSFGTLDELTGEQCDSSNS